MSQYFGGVQALSGGLANQEQLRRNAIRKLEAEGKIEKGSWEREMASIDHDGVATKNVGGRTSTTVYEAPPTYESKEEGSTGNGEASTGVKGAVRKLFKK